MLFNNECRTPPPPLAPPPPPPPILSAPLRDGADIRRCGRAHSDIQGKWLSKYNIAMLDLPILSAPSVPDIKPGPTPTTRTLLGPHSTAKCLVNASTRTQMSILVIYMNIILDHEYATMNKKYPRASILQFVLSAWREGGDYSQSIAA